MPEVAYRESSKIQILDVPRMNPGKCVLCGASDGEDRQYVDIGVTIEWYGVVYFCTFCFTEALNIIGSLSKEQADALEAELEAARKRILEFTAKERALDDAIGYLRNSGLFDHASGSSATYFPSVYPSIDQDPKRLHDDILKQYESGTAEISESSKQSSGEQGSNDVSGVGEFNI